MKTLREMERDYNIRFKGDPDMKLSTWLRERNFVSLANTLERAEGARKRIEKKNMENRRN